MGLFKLVTLFSFLLLSNLAYAQHSSNAPLEVKTNDGTVDTFPYQVKVSNSTLTDNGDGTATLNTSGSGAGEPWTLSGTNIYPTTLTNNVGIGTSTTTDAITVKTLTGGGITSNDAPTGTGCNSKVGLLLHGDGTNGGTIFTDANCNGSGAQTPTVNGTITTSTAAFKFGTASILGNGSTGYLSYGSNSAWTWAADVTVDFWFNFNTLPTSTNSEYFFGSPVFSGGTDTTVFGGYVYNNAGTYSMRFTGHTYDNSASGTTISVTTGTWHHYAFVRTGGVWKMFFDGTQVGSNFSNSSSIAMTGFDVMTANSSGASSGNGYMDEFRVSPSTAQWTANFTPPTIAYAQSSALPAIILQDSGALKSKYWVDGVNSDAIKIDDATGTKMTILQGGNVGIGTTTPVGGLSVMNGNVGIGTWVPAQTLDVVGGSGGTLRLERNSVGSYDFGLSGLMNGDQVDLLETGNVASAGYAWRVSNGSNTVTFAMGINSSGNVGIGTTTPVGGLAVMNGNVGIGTWVPDSLLSLGTSLQNIKLALYDGGASAMYGIGANGVLGALTFVANGSLNGTPQMTLFNTGNVSIGTTKTANGLDIASNVSIGTTYAGYNAAPTNGLAVQGNVGIGTWVPGASLDIKGGNINLATNQSITWPAGNSGVVSYDGSQVTISDQGVVVFQGNGGSGPIGNGTPALPRSLYVTTVSASASPVLIRGMGAQTAALTQWQNSSATVLDVVDPNGNIGIGTTLPGAGLDMGQTNNLRIPTLKSATGVRYICVDTNGQLESQSAACVGT